MLSRFLLLFVPVLVISCVGNSGPSIEDKCNAGDAESCRVLGVLFRAHEADRWPEAMSYFQKACDFGGSCTPIAVGYLNGEGVSKNVSKATSILENDCKAGTGPSCYFLAGVYEEGNGVERDMDKVATLLDQACVGGSDPGCVKSGRVAKNQQACASGDEEACFNAGLFYRDSEGPLAPVLNNHAKARYHFQKACDAGHSEGCSALATVE